MYFRRGKTVLWEMRKRDLVGHARRVLGSRMSCHASSGEETQGSRDLDLVTQFIPELSRRLRAETTLS